MQIYFAPMEGVTGFLFRNAHKKYFGGVDKYYAPFLSPGKDQTFTKKAIRDLLPENNDGVNLVPQLMTCKAEEFLPAAEKLAQMGFCEVNLNLGCPSGTVTAKGKGAGFLAKPRELDWFLDEIFSKTTVPISIKTRLGMKDPEEFEPILEIYEQYPICELTIHPRVREEFYRGRARVEDFEKALTKTRLPLCYNGDLFRVDDILRFAEYHPQVPAVMAGRGLIGDPALARRAKGGPSATKAELEAFQREIYEGYCREFGNRKNAMLRMKELWFYLIHLFEDNEKLAKKIKKAGDPDEFESQIAAVFRQLELRVNAEPGWRPC